MKKVLKKRTAAVILGMILGFSVWAGNNISAKAADNYVPDMMVRYTDGELVLLYPGDTLTTADMGFSYKYSKDNNGANIGIIGGVDYNWNISQFANVTSGAILALPSGEDYKEFNCWRLGVRIYDNKDQYLLIPYEYKTPEAAVPETGTKCTHSCQWTVESGATETTDGVMVYACTRCGEVTDRRAGGTGETSAYAVYNKNTILKVEQAESGSTVQIDTQIWTSFSQKVMEAIAARRDITVELTYRIAGKTWKIIIPAGTAVPADVAYAGFDGYLAGLYGKTEK